jgi:hypothetical protein
VNTSVTTDDPISSRSVAGIVRTDRLDRELLVSPPELVGDHRELALGDVARQPREHGSCPPVDNRTALEELERPEPTHRCYRDGDPATAVRLETVSVEARGDSRTEAVDQRQVRASEELVRWGRLGTVDLRRAR